MRSTNSVRLLATLAVWKFELGCQLTRQIAPGVDPPLPGHSIAYVSGLPPRTGNQSVRQNPVNVAEGGWSGPSESADFGRRHAAQLDGSAVLVDCLGEAQASGRPEPVDPPRAPRPGREVVPGEEVDEFRGRVETEDSDRILDTPAGGTRKELFAERRPDSVVLRDKRLE
jgi:hypothetical protein